MNKLMHTRVFHMIIWLFLIAIDLSGIEAPPKPATTVYIPMRDGLELPTDLYFPSGAAIGNEYPCILMRVPAGRTAMPWLQLSDIAKHGYVVAIQDTRSILDLEGKTMPYVSDGWGEAHQDGFDTIEWLSKSSFTNGKVGTIGFSAAGITQVMLAPTAPSALKCQYIGQAASSMYHHAIFPGGEIHKHQVEAWLGLYAPDPSVLEYVKSQRFYNDFWKTVDSVSVADRVDVPALHYTGWFDTFLQGTIDGFVARQEKGKEGAKGNQKLIIGPWHHFWPFDLSLGDYKVPENGKSPPFDMSPKRWFDFHLKGVDNGIAKLPRVIYYVMGPFDGASSSGNLWRQANVWPVPSVETTWFLTAEKNLREKADKKEKAFAFESSPFNPVPTIGGRNLFLESGPKDQRSIERRKDVLVFTSDTLKEDIEVTGKIVAKLYLSSNVADTNIAVRLTDVYPDGRSVLIADGLTRTGIVNSPEKESTLGKVREVTIDLSSISIVLAKGHLIRIIIAGSNYPRYEKNNNAGLGNDGIPSKVAKDVIHIGEAAPSQLILPVVRKGTRWLVEPQAQFVFEGDHLQ